MEVKVVVFKMKGSYALNICQEPLRKVRQSWQSLQDTFILALNTESQCKVKEIVLIKWPWLLKKCTKKQINNRRTQRICCIFYWLWGSGRLREAVVLHHWIKFSHSRGEISLAYQQTDVCQGKQIKVFSHWEIPSINHNICAFHQARECTGKLIIK